MRKSERWMPWTTALRFVYLELGRLNIAKDEPEKCSTLLEKFAFSLKYMHELEERPENFDEDILKKMFSAAEFANVTIEQQTDYEIVMRTELDIIAEKNHARETGLAEGPAEGAAQTSREIATKMLKKRIPLADLAEITGLSEEEIGIIF